MEEKQQYKFTYQQLLTAYLQYYNQCLQIHEDPMTFKRYVKRAVDKSGVEVSQ